MGQLPAVSPTFSDALKAPTIHTCRLFEFHQGRVLHDSDTAYGTDNVRNVSWNGHDYLALGHLISLSQIATTGDLQTNDLQIHFSLMEPSLYQAVITNKLLHKQITILNALFDLETNQLLDQPYVIFSGFVSESQVQIRPGETAVFVLNVANIWSQFSRKRGRYCNDQEQSFLSTRPPYNLRTPDRGFKYAANLLTTFKWDVA